MSETVYKTTVWGQTYSVSADWAQASSPVHCRYEDGPWIPFNGRQVASFRHRPLDALAAYILAGEDVDDTLRADVDAAIARAEPIPTETPEPQGESPC